MTEKWGKIQGKWDSLQVSGGSSNYLDSAVVCYVMLFTCTIAVCLSTNENKDTE